MTRPDTSKGHFDILTNPRQLVGIAILSAVLMLDCKYVENRKAPGLPRAQFGIFFGTQVQQRKTLPLIASNLKQQQGFRLDFDAKLTRPSHVEWELDFPTKRQGPRGPGNAPRGIRKGQAELPQGTDRYEQQIELLPTDSVGTWNIRVRVDGTVVLDRPFRVVPEGSVNTNG